MSYPPSFQDRSPEEMKELVFKYASLSSAWKTHCLSLYYKGSDNRTKRESMGGLTSSTIAEETGCQPLSWAKCGEATGVSSTLGRFMCTVSYKQVRKFICNETLSMEAII